jgi:DNA adenine methylase
MKYMGSKAKYAKEILDAIMNEIGYYGITTQSWVEPFVGGANMMSEIKANVSKIGNDINVHLIEMFKALQKGWTPPDSISEKEYKELQGKSNIHLTSIESPLIGFVGIGCSYAGKWFGGYARGNANNGTPRNYCLESKKNVLKQTEKLQGVHFTSHHYDSMKIPDNSIIYCDPPYNGTTSYKGYSFDHQRFWKWCEEKVVDGHKVFVSEYNAPEGWRCIWQKEVNNSLTKETGSKQGIEKLFTK